MRQSQVRLTLLPHTQDPKKTSMRADGLVKLLRPFAKFLPDMSCENLYL